jgi:hypothetical protein
MSETGRKEIGRRVSIVELLRERGILPARSQGGRHLYCCPLHAGDRTPSLCVYEKEDGYQDFFCYGCKSHGDVVALKAKLDHISISQAFSDLAARCGFDPNNPVAVIDDCLAILGSCGSDLSDVDAIQNKVIELTSSYRVQRMLNMLDEEWVRKWVLVDDAVRAGDVSGVIDA